MCTVPCRLLLTILLAVFLALAPLLAAPARAADSAVVFMYHRFGEDRHPATNVRLDAFVAQLDLLESEGFEVIGLRRLLAFLEGQGDLPERAVVLTIDDAYASIHAHAWPLLRERGMPFTVFVATDPVDEGFGDYLDWAQLREMAKAGVTIANHGAGHLHLPARSTGESEAAWRQRVRDDLARGAARLQQELGDTGALVDDVFAYPYGEYDTTVAAIAQELGWIAFGQHSGAIGAASDRRALPRFPINETYSGLDDFRTKANSLPLSVTRIEPWDPVTGAEPVLDVWLAPSEARWAELACFVGGQGRVPVDWQGEGRHFRVAPAAPLPPGRQRVNCTAPSPSGRYFWFSHQWLVRDAGPADGR